MYNQLAISSSSSSSSSSYFESLKILEADVQHANTLAEAIPMGENNIRLQMKLIHSNFASLLLILLRWIDLSCSCLIPRYLNLFHVLVYKVQSDGQPKLTTHGRKATISEFYGVILPSLQLLHSNLDELKSTDIGFDLKRLSKKITKEARSSSRFSNAGLEREEECGICLETCTKMVLPNCCHSMCIKCYRNWNLKSQSCPFCRGSMKRVNSVKSATLPSITEKDWEDIKFGVENEVDFYAVSFVKDAQVVHELKKYLQNCGADIHVIVKIESADSIPNLHSIITASDGAMVARGDLGAELPIEEVPILQEKIINLCRSMGKAVIVATNMLESMIVHPTPTRAEVSDIAIAVREGADAVMLSGETAHGKFPLKAAGVMHTVALRTEATITSGEMPPNLGQAFKNHMSEMFAYHATMMSNTLGTSTVVFTRTGFMAILLSHYRPSGTIYAFTNEKKIQQRLALYQGVCPIYMEFSDDAEDTFAKALSTLLKQGMVKKGEEIAIVQSGSKPIWRSQSTHNIQVRKV